MVPASRGLRELVAFRTCFAALPRREYISAREDSLGSGDMVMWYVEKLDPE